MAEGAWGMVEWFLITEIKPGIVEDKHKNRSKISEIETTLRKKNEAVLSK